MRYDIYHNNPYRLRNAGSRKQPRRQAQVDSSALVDTNDMSLENDNYNLSKMLKQAEDSRDWYKRRVELLERMQKHMRDPERTIVCDILANGAMLPDIDGSRYGLVSTE